MHKFKRKLNTATRPRAYLAGLLISVGVLVITSLVMSALAYSSPDPTGKIGIYSLVSLILSAAISGFMVSRFFSDGGIGIALLTSFSVVLILMLFGVIIGGGRLGGGAFMNYLSYFGVALLFTIFGKKRERRHRRR